jgi:Zn-dependent peptidase ImmA (M78 family)/transcriptional regulator with XRE-family HTH domain
MAEHEQINPRILAWARETAGLSLEEAAQKLGLASTGRTTGAEKLAALEAGERAPTPQQLQRAASVYRRPLVVFYLAEPPGRGERGEDFRTTSDAASPRENATLDALLRDLRARQQLLRAMLEDQDDAHPLSFVGSSRIGDGRDRVVAAIRSALSISVQDQRAAKGPEALFNLLRTATERLGIYVLLVGDMGSHHSDLSEDVFRGIALADDIAPFVIVNDNDAKPARSFTLLHEVAHLWIGASGVSGPLQTMSANAIERFCNDVAGELLLPSGELVRPAGLQDAPFDVVLRATERIALEWNVSQGLAAYRMDRLGWIGDGIAGRLFRHFAQRWRNEKQRSRDGLENSGPSYYVVRRHRLGAALLSAVRRGLQSDVVTHTRAARILGVSPTNVGPLLQERLRAA